MHRLPDRTGCTPRHLRQAYSLAELLIVMTVTGVVMSIAMSALARLYQAQSTELQIVAESASWRRLSNDFRLDIHDARQAAIPASDRLELQTDGGTVVWSVARGAALRTVSPRNAGDSVVMTESYRLTDMTFKFEIDTAATLRHPIAALLISRNGSPGMRPVRHRIDAAVGLSRQFEARSRNDTEVAQ
jgi:prepilin-type N-terminal cleavage/methylation domain-containing protein